MLLPLLVLLSSIIAGCANIVVVPIPIPAKTLATINAADKMDAVPTIKKLFRFIDARPASRIKRIFPDPFQI